ncbi:extracellular solute-binding protein [Haloarcula sp. S1AR25-5A]|uniref:Extracellular solute-binding protein n=1 Tax=Haloarcula terrestris TaxID=2950533 RepID=A0AAE4JGL0_9EURY|nr:extracellular solute-binding protein [Haloarcula terrestris]MDS0221557.1 extracellular solute-binding protein [Haloarcula terrestris]
MSDQDKRDSRRRSSVSRRRFVQAAGATGVTAGIAGCADFVGGGGDGGDGDSGGDGGSTGDGSGRETQTIQLSMGADILSEAEQGVRDAFRNAGLPDWVELTFARQSQDTGEVRSNFNRRLSAGETKPDAMLMDNGWVNIFIQRGQIQNLTEMLPEEILSTVNNDYFQGFTDTARDPGSGNLFGVPLFPDFPTLLYRKDLAENAGYSPESNNWATEPMTWEEWSNIAADIQDNAGLDYGFTTQWDIYVGTACCTFNEVMSSWGGAYFGGRDNLFGPVGDRPITVDEPETIKSLNMMRKFVHNEDFGGEFDGYGGGFTPTNILSWIENPSLAPFEEGNSAFHRNWPYAIASAGSEDVFGQDLGTMPIPYGVPESEAAQPGTGGTTSALGGWHVVANPNSENTEGLIELFRAVTQDSFNLDLLKLWGWLPPKPELFNSDTARDQEPTGRYMDTLRVAGENTMPRPTTAVWGDQTSNIAQQANRAVNQDTTSEEAMTALASALEETES